MAASSRATSPRPMAVRPAREVRIMGRSFPGTCTSSGCSTSWGGLQSKLLHSAIERLTGKTELACCLGDDALCAFERLFDGTAVQGRLFGGGLRCNHGKSERRGSKRFVR